MITTLKKLADLKPHPENYNEHPDDQVEEIAKSIEQHGQYRAVVVTEDDYILAGHGVCLALAKNGAEEVVTVVLPYAHDDAAAKKVLAADNTLSMFAMRDDRALSELLKEIKDFDEWGLEGTGFDEMMLANLVMVTRPASEIENHDAAGEWLGMPGFEPKKTDLRVVVLFRDDEDRKAFCEKVGLPSGKETSVTWSTWWPPKAKEDLKSVKYE